MVCGYSFVLLGCAWPRATLSVLNTSLCSHMARVWSEKTNDGIGVLCDLVFFLFCALIPLPFTRNAVIFLKLKVNFEVSEERKSATKTPHWVKDTAWS